MQDENYRGCFTGWSWFSTHTIAREHLEGHRVYVERLVRCGKAVQPNRERDLGAIEGERFDLYVRGQPFELETNHKPLDCIYSATSKRKMGFALAVQFTVRERQIP